MAYGHTGILSSLGGRAPESVKGRRTESVKGQRMENMFSRRPVPESTPVITFPVSMSLVKDDCNPWRRPDIVMADIVRGLPFRQLVFGFVQCVLTWSQSISS